MGRKSLAIESSLVTSLVNTFKIIFVCVCIPIILSNKQSTFWFLYLLLEYFAHILLGAFKLPDQHIDLWILFHIILVKISTWLFYI